MSPRWEHFAHGADIGIRGIGTTKAEAFEQAALAMTAVVIEPSTIAARESRNVECAAPDDELLLVEWLNALIYLMSVQRMLFSRFSVQLDRSRLQGEAAGEKLDPARHHAVVELKGATYTMLSVKQQCGLWVAQTVVDV
jgi:SHS2 domain-containing protein